MTGARMEIKKIDTDTEKSAIAADILGGLPEWFGIPESVAEYVKNSAGMPFWAVYVEGRPVGFMALKETGTYTAEIYVCGIRKEYHRKGMGRALLGCFLDYAAGHGYEYVQVKTVQKGHYPEYDRTNAFYGAVGFRELECFPDLWDVGNPCQVYVKYIGGQCASERGRNLCREVNW